MRWRRLVVTATVGFAVLAWAGPAMAKGPDQATITGPGLDTPIVVSGYGEPGSGSGLGELAEGSGLFLVMFEASEAGRRLAAEKPAGSLGPRFELSYRVPDGTGTGSTVRQELYPQAPGGPVTYTEAGQAVFGTTTLGGWYRTPAGFGDVLERLGVPATTDGQPPAEPAAAPAPVQADPAPAPRPAPSPSTPWLPIAAVTLVAVAVLAGVLFGRWRVNASRSRALQH
jgi:hypothetical protein